ncbi:MAG: D-2-hydroxyacid dehydrogenase [Lachnospiraceae bacterium]|nr:D-2-hydroxyacid dehydrogenase [Lachnospiraceae bacterium]
MNIILPDYKTITDGDISLDIFKKYGDVKYYERLEYEQLPEILKDADVIFCNKTPLNPETLRYADNLKYIGLFATGYNNVDIEYAKARGIRVCNAGSYSTNAVAQHTFALILGFFNKTAQYDSFIKDGGYARNNFFSSFEYGLEELAGKTIGIIGAGSIGQTVARIAEAFDMRVIVYSRTVRFPDRYTYVSFDELLERSDIITIHCPLNEASYKLFDDAAFAKCREGAFLVNTARGPIVDEAALCRALKSGRLKGAALDVFEVEPLPQDSPLMHVPNIILTPHIAWAAKETRQRLLGIVVDCFEAYLHGGKKNVIV